MRTNEKQEIADLACAELEKLYPGAQCTLDYGEPYQLMMATRLAAQCTDARVNVVTKTLFKKYPTLQAFADADLAELEQDVKPCGFYHTKAKSLKEMAGQLINNFGGEVPLPWRNSSRCRGSAERPRILFSAMFSVSLRSLPTLTAYAYRDGSGLLPTKNLRRSKKTS